METQVDSGPSTLPEDSAGTVKRFLDPMERISEVLFGLIMVLTFTCSLSVAQADRDEVRTMLIGALGCNLAWGIIDALFFLMACLTEKQGGVRALRELRATTHPEQAHRIIVNSLPPLIASILKPSELESVSQRLRALPEPAARARLSRDNWLGALSVFLWVFVTTLPVVVPFVFMSSITPAMRVSNAIAIVMLFITGFAYGRIAGRHPLLVGLSMVFVGILLVAMTIALGG